MLKTRRAGTFVMIGVTFLLTAFPQAGLAKECQNACQMANNDLCLSFFAPKAGYLHSHVLEKGVPVQIMVQRQSGCSTKSVTPEEVSFQAAATAQGPFAPLPTQRRADGIYFTPTQSGMLLLTAAHKDGAGRKDQLVLFVVDPAEAQQRLQKVSLRLLPPRGLQAEDAEISLRYVPKDRTAVETAGFRAARWPTFIEAEAPSKGPRRFQLPRGDYEVSWQNPRPGRKGRLERAVVAMQVLADGEIPVTIPEATVRTVPVPPPTGAILLAVRPPSGATSHFCINNAAKTPVTVRLPVGKTQFTWYPAQVIMPDSNCMPGLPGGPALYEETVVLKARDAIQLPWPSAQLKNPRRPLTELSPPAPVFPPAP